MPAIPVYPPSSALLSQQVSGSRYFFHDLAPTGKHPWMLVMGGLEHCNPDYLIDRPGYLYHIIEFILEGRGQVTLAGQTHEIGPGSVFAIAPNEACRMACDPRAPMTKFFFAFAGRAIGARLRQAGLKPGHVRQLTLQTEARAAAEDLLREGRRNTPLAPAICATLAELFFLRLEEASGPATTQRSRAHENFQRCKALLDSQSEGNTTLEQVAAQAGLDVSSVCRLFRRFQGGSPYQYLLRRKMTLAAELLMEHNCAVKEAAQRVGFTDPLHFTRCFKSVHGVPPSRLNRISRTIA